jgi:hypothetical protein
MKFLCRKKIQILDQKVNFIPSNIITITLYCTNIILILFFRKYINEYMIYIITYQVFLTKNTEFEDHQKIKKSMMKGIITRICHIIIYDFSSVSIDIDWRECTNMYASKFHFELYLNYSHVHRHS